MIAEIAPLRRLPRSKDFFDYVVPEGMDVCRGDLVSIPFRSRFIKGIVLRLVESSVANVRPIQSIIQKQFLDHACLTIYEQTAVDLVQSIATVLYQAFLERKTKTPITTPPLSLSVRRKELAFIRSARTTMATSLTSFIQTTDLLQTAAILEGIHKNYPGAWILAPHIHDHRVIAGARTRQAALRCHEHPPLIALVRSGSPEHEQYDRNPRYDARELAWKIHHQQGARLVFFDTAPRVHDLVRCHNILWQEQEQMAVPEMIDLNAERQRGYKALLTDPLLEATEMALQSGKNVLFSYNRKEQSEVLFRCKDCGAETLDTTACPRCKSIRLKKIGLSNKDVERALQASFPQTPVVRIEKGHIMALPSQPTIVLATRYYTETVLDPIHPPTFGLVAELQADLGLHQGRYDATEQTLLALSDLRGLATRWGSTFLVQTTNPDLVRKMLYETPAYLNEEKRLRERFHYPPFGSIYQLTDKNKPSIAHPLERPIPKNETERTARQLKSTNDSTIIRVWH